MRGEERRSGRLFHFLADSSPIARFADVTQNCNFRIFLFIQKPPPYIDRFFILNSAKKRNFTRIRPKLILKIVRISKYRQMLTRKWMDWGNAINFNVKNPPGCRPHISISLRQILMKVRSFLKSTSLIDLKRCFRGIIAIIAWHLRNRLSR